jgi:uncharacterized protein (TIGR03083 family)
MTTMSNTGQEVRRPALDREVAMLLAATEYARFLHVLRELPPDAWTRPSGCPGWDVRQVASHLLGMAEMTASLREQIRQTRKAKKAGGTFINALTGLQVSERAGMSPPQIINRFAAVAPKAARSRRRTPGFVRARTMPDPQPVGGKPDSRYERWTFGYLIDIVLTRDPWLHRTELCAAGGLTMELTAAHDGVLVADVAHEWAGRHGQACSLLLTGPAGGSWQWGQGGTAIELDAVEFCRLLAGRGEGEGLLATEVPF